MELPVNCRYGGCRHCSDGQTEYKDPPVVISQTIVNALTPSSPWYPVFWPVIIEQATECQRWRCLRKVNRFFASVDRRIISEKAKAFYFSKYYQQIVNRFPKDMGPKLDRHGEHWASWGFGKSSFGDFDSFLDFCELADVDLDAGVFHFDRYPELAKHMAEGPGGVPDCWKFWVFVSRSRDVFFETGRLNPLIEIEREDEDDEESACYIRDFGITGTADKVKRLLEYAVKEVGLGVEWGERNYI